MFYRWLFFFCFLSGSIVAQNSLPIQLYEQNGLWGLTEEKPLTPAVYESIIPIKNTSFFIVKKHTSKPSINSTGVISSNGKTIIPFSYLQITASSNSFIVNKWENGEILYGVVSQSNNIILNVRFKKIQAIKSYWVVQSFSNELHLYTSDGQILKQLAADSISISPNPQYMYVYKGGKIGLSDYTGNDYLPAKYKSIDWVNNHWVTTSFNEWKIISNSDTTTIYADSLQIWDRTTCIIGLNNQYQIEHNNKLVGNTYNSILPVAPSLGITNNGTYYGAVHKNGKEILPTIFMNIYHKKGYFYVLKNNKWSLYDSLGNKKTVFKYDSIGEVNNGLFPIKRIGKWGFMNRKGKEVVHCIYDSLAEFKNGKAIISYYGAMGIINIDGKWIVKPHYDQIRDFSYNFFIYKIDNQYHLKNYNGELIYFSSYPLVFRGETIFEIRNQKKNEISTLGIQVQKQAISSSEDNLWKIIEVDNKYGIVDKNGSLVITYRYDSLIPFTEELAAFKLRGKWGFINKDEQIMVQPQFSIVSPFKNGISKVSQNSKFGLINTNGKFVLKPKYESLELLMDIFWLATENGLTGIFSYEGKVIIQPKYDKLEYINSDLIIISKYGKYGAVDTNGVSVLPRVYNFIGYDVNNELLLLKKEN